MRVDRSMGRGPLRAWAALLALVLMGLLAYAVAGPYLAVRAIRGAVQRNDAAALADNVDFPALRASLKAQLEDRLARRVGPGLQSSMLGGIGLSMASGLVDASVDTMVTPLGIGALMQGRVLWARFDVMSDDVAPERARLSDPDYRIESPSRVTATMRTASGAPVVMVLSRRGLRWRLSDLRLPR